MTEIATLMLDGEKIAEALSRRGELIERLHTEETNAYRLFHGVAEGCPGLTIDRYGPLVIVQTFRAPLSCDGLAEIAQRLKLGDDVGLVYNHRGAEADPSIDDWHQPAPEWLEPQICTELGLRYEIQARHRGLDPLLFLDLRAARRHVLRISRKLRVLNLFAYTCGAGICAASSGATEVLNIDFSSANLEIGEQNAKLNRVNDERFTLMQQDVIPVIRQLAGLPIKGRGARARYIRLGQRKFDLIFLDPPRWAKSRFGAVDVVRDYQSLFKPVLLATSPKGVVIATNHVAKVDLDEWVGQLRRCAEKAERPLADVTVLPPEGDFPSFDGRHPLKVAVCRISC